MAEHEYKKRLCDLVEVRDNLVRSVELHVKPGTTPEDLIQLGGFEGNERKFRISKAPRQTSVTVFRDGGEPYRMDHGAITTPVSGDREKIRNLVLECAHLDFGIYTHGGPAVWGVFVKLTTGRRDLDSPRRYTLRSYPEYSSLYMNNQLVARNIPNDKLGAWLGERNIRLEATDVEHRSEMTMEYGNAHRAHVPERDQMIESIGNALSEQDRFDQAIDETLGAFLNKTGWKDLDATAAVKEFARFAKQESPFFNQSLESAMEAAKGRAAEKNASRPDKDRTRKAPEQDR